MLRKREWRNMKKIILKYSIGWMLFFCLSMGAASSLRSSPVIIFISFSMPENSIKQWMSDAEKIQAPVVVRGLINNSFKETMQRMSKLTQDNHGGLQLDPTVFHDFHIDKVPAMVVNNGHDFDVIYGNVTLPFALKKVADKNDAVSIIAENSLKEWHRT